MLSRIFLVPVSGVRSSYKSHTGEILDVSYLKSACYLTPDANKALHALDAAVSLNGGQLYVTELFRPWAIQDQAYQDWKAGRRTAFASPAGESFHQAGRGIDIDINNLNFPGLKSNWLSLFWNIAIPLGWEPIVSKPDSTRSESWHFQFHGKDWSGFADKAPDKLVAQCCILDAGQWTTATTANVPVMFIQSQCNRLLQYDKTSPYLECDGIFGLKTHFSVMKLIKDTGGSIFDIANELKELPTPIGPEFT